MSNIEQNLAFILSSRYGEDVRQAIHDAIHDCYEDGKAGAVDLVAREQIANLVANAGDKSKDSELVDIRVGYDGTEYSSAGEAVRGQVGKLSEDIFNGSALDYESVSPFNIRSATEIIEQLITEYALKPGYYNRGTNIVVGSSAFHMGKIRVKKGIPFYLKNVYGYFCTIIYDDKTIKPITDQTGNSFDYSETPEKDGWMYITVHQDYVNNAMCIIGSSTSMDYFQGVKQFELPKLNIPKLVNVINVMNENEIQQYISIDKNATPANTGFGVNLFNKITAAIEYIKSHKNVLGDRYFRLKIYEADYDIYDELGGDEWIRTVVHSNGERQGLQIPNFVDLEGIGKVVFNFMLPDDITLEQSTCVSCINFLASSDVRNIVFNAKNCRYVCHDEMNNAVSYIKRNIENCEFHHYGNIEGLWEYPSAYGAGTGSGGIYNFKDVIFTSKYRPFGIHNNSNQSPCVLSMDGIVATGGSYRQSITISSYGTNHNGNSKAFLKNIIADKEISTGTDTETPESELSWDIYKF